MAFGLTKVKETLELIESLKLLLRVGSIGQPDLDESSGLGGICYRVMVDKGGSCIPPPFLNGLLSVPRPPPRLLLLRPDDKS